MQPSLKSLAFAISLLGLFTINLSFTLPVNAALPCENSNIVYHSNGSIKNCTIFNKININVGSFGFLCEQGHSISFDEKANFQSCVISDAVKIKRGNAIEICPKKSRVSVFIDSKNQSDNQLNCGG